MGRLGFAVTGQGQRGNGLAVFQCPLASTFEICARSTTVHLHTGRSKGYGTAILPLRGKPPPFDANFHRDKGRKQPRSVYSESQGKSQVNIPAGTRAYATCGEISGTRYSAANVGDYADRTGALEAVVAHQTAGIGRANEWRRGRRTTRQAT